MNNRDVFNDLDDVQWLLATREFYECAIHNNVCELAKWLNKPIDEWFWFDRLAILKLEKEKYNG